MLKRVLPPLAIVLLALLFFADLLVQPGWILYSDHSDIISEHIPVRRFLVRSYQRDGELPLWCPNEFAGRPFVHDIQAGLFYPPHALLLVLPEERAGVALSWLVVLHVILAGWCMYAYARGQRLHPVAALTAAFGYMFAGKWLLHLLGGGHYVVIGLAWLPLVLLLLERAIRRGSLVAATAAGLVFGLLILSTQPQWTFYASLFIAAWSFAAVLDGVHETASLRRLWLRFGARWAGFGVWTALIGLGVAAIQLLPTLEAAGYSCRANGQAPFDTFGSGVQSFLFLMGPALTKEPFNIQWENRGGLTLLWLTAAALAGICGRGRTRYEAAVTMGLIVFAIGGSRLVQDLPGFNLFRLATRMFVIVGFPVALLAGRTTQALFFATDASEWHRRGRWLLLRLTAALIILAGGFALRQWLTTSETAPFHPYWASLVASVPLLYWLFGAGERHAPTKAVAIWCAVLFLDCWALTWPLAEARPEPPLYQPSACVRAIPDTSPGQVRVLDRNGGASGANAPLGYGSPLAFLLERESLRGCNPLDLLRYKEYLQFVADEDRPLQAFSSTLTFPVIGDFPIRNKRLLDLLGVRYLLQPRAAPLENESEWEAVADDENPAAYDMVGGGVQPLPPYRVYRNKTALPRAFVVFRAGQLPPAPEVLARLRATDFTQEVLLEHTPPAKPPMPTAAQRAAVITSYRPNRIRVEVEEGPQGWLVLADPWFPGWVCSVNGQLTAVERANYAFRAVALPAEKCDVEFRFEPASYRRGRAVSAATLLGASLLIALLACIRWIGRRRKQEGSAQRHVSGVVAE